jgi:hypothetical protein
MARVNSKDASGTSAEAPHSRAWLDSKFDVFRAADKLQYGNRNLLWSSQEFLNGNILSRSTVEEAFGMSFELHIIEGCQI